MRDQAQCSTAMTTNRKQILNESSSFHNVGWWKRLGILLRRHEVRDEVIRRSSGVSMLFLIESVLGQ